MRNPYIGLGIMGIFESLTAIRCRWHTAMGKRPAVKKVFAVWQESLSW